MAGDGVGHLPDLIREQATELAQVVVVSALGNGADVSILLCGHAVNFALRRQDAAGLAFGDKGVAHPPQLDQDLARLIAAKVAVSIIDEGVRERELPADRLIAGISTLSRNDVAAELERFDHVWRW